MESLMNSFNSLMTNVVSSNAFNCFRSGKYQEAIDSCDIALIYDKNCKESWSVKASSLYLLGQFEEAIECFNQVIAIDGSSESAWKNKAFSLCSLGRFEEAIECFDQAITMNRNDEETWYSKGTTLLKLSRYEEADECFNQAVAIDADFERAWFQKGLALSVDDTFEEAIECYNRAILLRDDHMDSHYFKGYSLLSLERYEEAIVCYDRVIAIDANNIVAWKEKASALSQLGRYEKAVHCCDMAISIDRNYDEAWKVKEFALHALEQNHEGIQCDNFSDESGVGQSCEEVSSLSDSKKAFLSTFYPIAKGARFYELLRERISFSSRGKSLSSAASTLSLDGETVYIPCIDFILVEEATDNFSASRLIGRGGFASVYSGRFPGWHKKLAFKVFSRDSLLSADCSIVPEESHQNFTATFAREIQVHESISHPNLARLLAFAVSEDENQLCLVFEFAWNGDLNHAIQSDFMRSSFTPSRIVRILCGVASALSALSSGVQVYRNGKFIHVPVVHGDLKPANIVLDTTFSPILIDFGMSRLLRPDDVLPSRSHDGNSLSVATQLSSENTVQFTRVMTTMGIRGGTPGYTAPEIFSGRINDLDVSADIYSFGVVCFDLIFGESCCSLVVSERLHPLFRKPGQDVISQLMEMLPPIAPPGSKMRRREVATALEAAQEAAEDLENDPEFVSLRLHDPYLSMLTNDLLHALLVLSFQCICRDPLQRPTIRQVNRFLRDISQVFACDIQPTSVLFQEENARLLQEFERLRLDLEQLDEEKEKARRDAEAANPELLCVYCCIEGRFADGCTCCDFRAGGHYIHRDCLEELIRHLSNSVTDISEICKHRGCIPCYGEQCSLCFSSASIARCFHDQPEVFALSLQIHSRYQEFLLTQKIEGEVRPQLAAKDEEIRILLDQLLALQQNAEREQDRLRRLRLDLIENVLNLKCPRCHQVWIDFSDCAAVTCSYCQAAFCGICCKDCGGDAHRHVDLECPHRIQGKGLFYSVEELTQCQNSYRRTLVGDFLRTSFSSERERKEFFAFVESDLRDLGLNSRIEEYS